MLKFERYTWMREMREMREIGGGIEVLLDWERMTTEMRMRMPRHNKTRD
jgi:hypothetical protein